MFAALMLSSTFATTVLVPLGPKPVVPLGTGLAVADMVWMTGLDPDSSYTANIQPPLIASASTSAWRWPP
ncbi:hypothetical protein ABT124_49665 [Streptomyces sp. NPDC001982]|uniref:hypothetical protein n=1 Tax=unclassified Streptomyces TaxID=2593676 RepID=UPI003322A2E1